MRRTILAPTTIAAALRARHVLVAVSLAALLVLALTLAAPVVAQEDDTSGAQTDTEDKDTSAQQAETSSCATSADEVATFTNKDTTFGPFRITGESFDVLYEAQQDRDSGSFKVAVTEDDVTVAETAEITVLPVDDVLAVKNEGPGTFSLDVESTGPVDFTITVCEADEAGAANAGDDDNQDGADNDQELSCDELLVLFRGEGAQYEDASDFADADVRAQVEVCLKREIVNAPDDNLPDTGGVSLLALAVLGVVSAAAGLSVIRGGLR